MMKRRFHSPYQEHEYKQQREHIRDGYENEDHGYNRFAEHVKTRLIVIGLILIIVGVVYVIFS